MKLIGKIEHYVLKTNWNVSLKQMTYRPGCFNAHSEKSERPIGENLIKISFLSFC